MHVSSSRHTASTISRLLAVALATVMLLAALCTTAMASAEAAPEPEANPASAQTNAELAACPGQTFSQPFEALGDSNYYTLVEGSEFEAAGEGWTLLHGAKIVEAARPDGSIGGVLDLPAGAIAVSPQVCVTLQYPSARTWVATAASGGTLALAVAYGEDPAKLSSLASSMSVARVSEADSSGWTLSQPLSLDPQRAGAEEGLRSARFVYAAMGSKKADFHVYGLYVDPRFGN